MLLIITALICLVALAAAGAAMIYIALRMTRPSVTTLTLRREDLTDEEHPATADDHSRATYTPQLPAEMFIKGAIIDAASNRVVAAVLLSAPHRAGTRLVVQTVQPFEFHERDGDTGKQLVQQETPA